MAQVPGWGREQPPLLHTFPPLHAGYFAAVSPANPPPPSFPPHAHVSFFPPRPPSSWLHAYPQPYSPPPPYPPPPYTSCPPPQPVVAAGGEAETGGEAEMEIESQEKMDATRGATLDAKTIEQLGLGWEKRSKDRGGLVARSFSPRCAGFAHAMGEARRTASLLT